MLPTAFPLLSVITAVQAVLLFFWLSQCFSDILDTFLSTFRSLLPCFPPILHGTFPDPLLHVPYCARSRDSLHRKAQLFGRDVLECRG